MAAGVPDQQVLCIDHLTMGLLAQNIVTPGVVTLLINVSMSLAHPALVADAGGLAATEKDGKGARRHWYSRSPSDTSGTRQARWLVE